MLTIDAIRFDQQNRAIAALPKKIRKEDMCSSTSFIKRIFLLGESLKTMEDNYIDKAIMEMHASELGSNPDIISRSLLYYTSHYARHIRASAGIKCGA